MYDALSKTFKDYESTYKSRLAKYLDEHEDNTRSLFLQNELYACVKTLGTLNSHNINSNPFGYKKVGSYEDISMLQNSGFDLD